MSAPPAARRGRTGSRPSRMVRNTALKRPVFASNMSGSPAVRRGALAGHPAHRWAKRPNMFPLHNVKHHADRRPETTPRSSVSFRMRLGGREVVRSSGREIGDAAGGARRDRTDDLMLAKHALSQLSYGPARRRRVTGLGSKLETRSRRLRTRPTGRRALLRVSQGGGRRRRRLRRLNNGGPGKTRTSDLTLIKRAL
jgi:hypothetical protein